MEKFEIHHSSGGENNREEKGITRRKFLKMLGISAVSAAVVGPDLEMLAAQSVSGEVSRYEKHGWGYTLEEMKKIYKEEYNAPEKLLKDVFWRENEKLMGITRGETFEVPQEFIDGTLKQFKEMLEQKTAKFLFRLDAFHGHFFMNEEKYEKEYGELSIIEQTRKLLKDRELGVLYHNSEHGKFLDKKAGELTAEEKELKEKRNVIGRYDGQPIEILPLPEGGKKLAAVKPGHNLGPRFTFAAHKDGVFTVVLENGEEICLDISFEDASYY